MPKEKKTAMLSQKTDLQKAPLVQPRDLLKKIEICSQALVVFSPFDWNFVREKTSPVPGSRKNLQFCSFQTIMVDKQSITLAGPAMSAPLAAMVLEILIAFGARQIVGLGSCGSLDKKLRIGDLLIPQNAIPDEGTSSHYPLHGKKINASPGIMRRIQALCEEKGQMWTSGKVWTTDAPFQETPQKIKRAQQQKAIAVEMELAAFFKVGTFFGVEAGALVVVSDELFSRQWNSGYGNKKFKETFGHALDIALQVLSRQAGIDKTR